MKPAILVVDDDKAVCELLQDVLDEQQFSVYCCHYGRDAPALLAQHGDIVLVMLDMMLPDTNGLLVLQQLQRQRPDLLVIMLTGMGSEAEMVVGLEMGAMTISPSLSIRAWWWRERARRCGAAGGLYSRRRWRAAGALTAGSWMRRAVSCSIRSANRCR